jgi:signal transduction histidine kinase
VVEVQIHNNGKGIKKKDFEAIFDKFYQSRNQNVKKPVGSGLGLAICKQIIEHHKRKYLGRKRPYKRSHIYFTTQLQYPRKTIMKKILIVDVNPTL